MILISPVENVVKNKRYLYSFANDLTFFGMHHWDERLSVSVIVCMPHYNEFNVVKVNILL